MKYKFSEWKELYLSNNSTSKQFKCWNCCFNVASSLAIKSSEVNNGCTSHITYGFGKKASVYFCTNCYAPFIFDLNGSTPIECPELEDIKNLPKNINDCYLEIQKCYSNKCYFACVMLMRNLLLRIAKQEDGDKEKDIKNFLSCINFLDNEKIIPKKSKPLLDRVRIIGNKYNHNIIEIDEIDVKEIELLLNFLIIILKIVYEFNIEYENK